MDNLWVFALVILFAIIAAYLRKRTLQKLLQELYTSAYVKKDKELFLLHVNSPQAKMLMSEGSRQLIKLNFYIANDEEDKVVKTVGRLQKTRLDRNNTKAFYRDAIGYYTEKQRGDSLALLEALKQKCDKSNDNDLILLYMDCQLLYDIYVKKDLSKIAPLQEAVDSDMDPQVKTVYRIRLARLYDFAGNHTQSKKQLKLAKEAAQEPMKQKIDHILKEGW